MEELIYTGPGGVTATLTTFAPGSHYGTPVLRIEGEGVVDWPDLGCADTLPSGLTAAVLVAMWGNGTDPGSGTFTKPTTEGMQAARRFCRQWPAGPQVEAALYDGVRLAELAYGDAGESIIRMTPAEVRRLAEVCDESTGIDTDTPPRAERIEASIRRIEGARID